MLERISFFPNPVNKCLKTYRIGKKRIVGSLVSDTQSTNFPHSGVYSPSIRIAINLCHTSEEQRHEKKRCRI
ncbi:unnamed protein product [Brassica napus]|uniref:(rape) hypothetical protein n=1 Tax=Brassica napus TaxID=3708 RepID=A0A816NTT5_BRANA|nr:unnamed protein product [Brassica napus]